MGCQSDVWLGNNLTFSVCTHDADTGALTDASAVPTYRVYEDETATAILTGSMAKLDDANTTGFYTEQVACTTANGFEHGKSYTVYIEATVDGITGGIAYGFTVNDLGTVADGIIDEALTEPTARPEWASMTVRKLLAWIGLLSLNEQTLNDATGAGIVRDDADTTDVSSRLDSDDGTTYTKGRWA